MTTYAGILIEESLENKEVLKRIRIVSSRVEPVTPKHKTPWLSQWTLHAVEIPEGEVLDIAEEISTSLDSLHAGSWYADFRNDTHHFIIFREKVFFIDRKSMQQYEAAKRYGILLGLPEYQLDFHPLGINAEGEASFG